MKKTLLTLLLAGLAATASASPVDDLLAGYRSAGAGPATAAAGRQLWERAHAADDGTSRRCASCHTDNLKAGGKHARTGKPIEPLAPSVNPARLSDVGDMEKWLGRNCRWTLGRECTPQEKSDLITFIATQ